jgi:uncharacterized protein
MSENHQVNRLAQETSPYLQQHAKNPVDWYPWGEEAIKKARREQKPVFLSIGYSACHWCHVMERESFEDPKVAEYLNKHFVSIKVDREERPDLDHIYMSAIQVLTQRGGWPMSVFLTSDLEPFYGGTYFPPEDRHGMPSFTRVLTSVVGAWTSKKEDVRKSARQLVAALEQMDSVPTGVQKLSHPLLVDAVDAVLRNFDSNHGGFGGAPKFFHSMSLRLCLRAAARDENETALKAAAFSLKKMAMGGIFDQIGGGFHRYSVDATWHVPHFEKMLYDNALLVETYLEAYQLTGDFDFASTARRTLDYLLGEMQFNEGGFYSTQDADSEGVEGKFYVWNHAEIEKELDPEVAKLFCEVFDVTDSGNWEHGVSVLRRFESDKNFAERKSMPVEDVTEPLLVASRKLLKVRSARIAPFTDTKILLSWNGMAIHAFCLGYQILGEEKYLQAAKRAAEFIVQKLQSPANGPAGGPLYYRVFKDGKSRFTAYLDDYAHWINALLSLYESDFDSRWIELAEACARTVIDEFWSEEHQSFFYTGNSHEKLCIRPKETHDGATPSGSAMAVTALLRLYRFTGREDWMTVARKCLERSEPLMRAAPTSCTQLLLAADSYINGTTEYAVVAGDDKEEYLQVLDLLRLKYSPSRIVACAGKAKAGVELAVLRDKKPVDGKTTVYACRAFRCETPWVGLEQIREKLE